MQDDHVHCSITLFNASALPSAVSHIAVFRDFDLCALDCLIYLSLFVIGIWSASIRHIKTTVVGKACLDVRWLRNKAWFTESSSLFIDNWRVSLLENFFILLSLTSFQSHFPSVVQSQVMDKQTKTRLFMQKKQPVVDDFETIKLISNGAYG
jgi:hypothetical protein